MQRLLKFLHEIGTVGLMGAAAAQLVIARLAEGMEPRDYAVARQAILRVSELILLPSVLIVLLSGLFAMAIHPTYQKRGWALIKAALTILVLECTLVAVQGPAQTAAAIADRIAAGDWSQYRELRGVLRHERGGTWMLLFLSTVNVALAVWRPRFFRRTKRTQAPETGADPDAEPEANTEPSDVQPDAEPESDAEHNPEPEPGTAAEPEPEPGAECAGASPCPGSSDEGHPLRR